MSIWVVKRFEQDKRGTTAKDTKKRPETTLKARKTGEIGQKRKKRPEGRCGGSKLCIISRAGAVGFSVASAELSTDAAESSTVESCAAGFSVAEFSAAAHRRELAECGCSAGYPEVRGVSFDSPFAPQ